MFINQGDVFWVRLPDDPEPHLPHPYVIIQDNALNHTPINTVVACALTSNLKRISLPGNVLIEAGEANLSRHSVVEVSKAITLEIADLGEYIGTVSEGRIAQILAGIRLVQSFLPL